MTSILDFESQPNSRVGNTKQDILQIAVQES